VPVDTDVSCTSGRTVDTDATRMCIPTVCPGALTSPNRLFYSKSATP
jgi:hypothetical protein